MPFKFYEVQGMVLMTDLSYVAGWACLWVNAAKEVVVYLE